ncbi:OLC1v1004502C1 [Oldenlandia corymbosa var. corymbosa]|uniref:OLC1v1004502C1 n=1 Tax=Oldenlandia corymbosa var. corymbosa TaxID=529605 RepID=A0AAV1DFF5_OLDCO|nr:OLC1v1004502C1 [Oldenlandia corymbosa var. corymbosa]
MMILKKVHLGFALFVLLTTLPTSISQKTTDISYCGKIRIQNQFFFQQNSTKLAPLNHMLLCKSQKLYYRTTLGLFQVSSVDYASKLLTVSHSFWSSTSQFISPRVLSAGFPHPPQPNSLVLLNCSTRKTIPQSVFLSNCTGFNGFDRAPNLTEGFSKCLVIEDVQKLDSDFHPRELNCTHYSRIYRKAVSLATDDNRNMGYELGTRISFDIPDHVPDPCAECKKPDGNCGAGLRCICHPIQCKDKVISNGAILNPLSNMLLSFLCFATVLLSFNNS